MALRRRDAPTLLLGGALIAAAILLIALGWQLTFFQDVWSVLMERRPFTAHSLLAPFNEHLIVLQILVEKVCVEIFGMGNSHPEMLFMTASLLAAATLMFAYVRRCAGEWIALFAACLLLFLGSAWQVLLWPFEMNFVASLAAGLGMLLMLEREDRRGDFFALVLLLVTIGFGSFGLAFAVAALVDICVRHRSRGWGRLWIFVIPALLYLGWYVGWGHEAEHHLTLRNVLDSPAYTVEGFAAAISSLTGLNSNLAGVTEAPDPAWGRPLLALLVGLAIWGQRRRPGVSTTFWPVVGLALGFWLLAAFNFIPGREASSTRYQYAGGAIVLLLAAELLRGYRFRPRALGIAAAVTALMILPNLAQLWFGYDSLKEQTVLTRGDTAAIDIARRSVTPGFALTPDIAGTPSLVDVSASNYLAAAREHGSPGYSPAELAAAPQVGRRWADVVLSRALSLSTRIETNAFRPGAIAAGGCVKVTPGEGSTEVALRTGSNRIYSSPGGEAKLSLRRFSQGEFPVALAPAPAGSATTIDIPADGAPAYPWYLQVESAAAAWVCPGRE